MGRFETWAKGWRLGILGPNGRAMLGAYAAILGDKLEEWTQRALAEHLPEYADDSASNLLTASERRIEPGPSESASDLATRLTKAVQQWQLASTPLGLLLALYYADFPGAVLVQQNGVGHYITGTPDLSDLSDLTTQPSWYVREDLGPNPAIPASTDGRPAIAAGTISWWTFDGGMDAEGNQYTSRFGVLFPSTATDPDLGTTDNLNRIRRVIKQRRPAKAKCMWIRVCSSGLVWGWPTTLAWGEIPTQFWGGTVTEYSP